MEFACEFVYVSPSINQKDEAKRNIKRSALLPPVNWLRPRSPPPPPPKTTNSAQIISPKSPKIIEELEKKWEEKKITTKPIVPFYENADFHNKSSSKSQQTPRKTALLPPHMKPAASPNTNVQTFTYDLPKQEVDFNPHPWDPNYSYTSPEGSGMDVNLPEPQAPPLPLRPAFMSLIPEYIEVLPSSHSSSSSCQKSSSPPAASPPNKADKGPLPGNPNVVLVSLGKLLSEEEEGQTIKGKPTSCSQCGSILDSSYDNVVPSCYFCRPLDVSPPPLFRPRDGNFWLNPDVKPQSDAEALLIFCIDVSGSMSITSMVSEGGYNVYRSRLQFVQEAVSQCVTRLSEQQPHTRVGLITFNQQVTVHWSDSFSSHVLSGAQLIESDFLKQFAAGLSNPPPLIHTRDQIHTQVMGLSANGATALGPAALLSVAVASRQPGSKVIICTDGRANTELGNLELEDDDARTLLSSTIFYQDLGDYAADQGVTVSVLSIEGTDCRLDELGRLSDRTGGKVVISSPNRLHPEFEQIIENRTIATHCSVTLLLPKPLRVRGEREAGHKATREVGNINTDTEITFQFGAEDDEEENTEVLSPGCRVSVQLQIRFRRRDGRQMIRVRTTERDVTHDSSLVLSSLSLSIIQLNSSQSGAALAVRGRFHDARTEGEQQRKLIERAIEHNNRVEDKQTYQEWIKTMEPIYNNIHNFTRRKSVISDSQSLTDAGAALLYNMKQSNRKSISLKNKHQP